VETNRYYQQFLDNSDDGPSTPWGDRSGNVCVFLALTLQMGHTVQGRLEDYWTKMEPLCYQFYGQTMVRARYYHILRFLHFTEWSWHGGWQTIENTRLIWNSKDKLLKILQPFRTFGCRRSHCEIQGKGTFQTVHPEKTKNVSASKCSNFATPMDIHDMSVYLGKDKGRYHLTATMPQWQIWQGE
jgi:hypothetical protein